MSQYKKYKYRGEIDERIVQALEREGGNESDLYVDSKGQLFLLVDNEGNYHPDDRTAARSYYQPLGIDA